MVNILAASSNYDMTVPLGTSCVGRLLFITLWSPRALLYIGQHRLTPQKQHYTLNTRYMTTLSNMYRLHCIIPGSIVCYLVRCIFLFVQVALTNHQGPETSTNIALGGQHQCGYGTSKKRTEHELLLNISYMIAWARKMPGKSPENSRKNMLTFHSWSRNPTVWIVLPKPISSARMEERWFHQFHSSQLTPWYHNKETNEDQTKTCKIVAMSQTYK